MFCTVYKWLISQAADSGKPVSGFVKNHIHRCDSCREFAQLCESLKPKFAQDKQAILKNYDEALSKKIISALPKERAPISSRQRSAGKLLARKPVLIPSLAAAFLVVVISIGVIFIAVHRSRDMGSFGHPSEWVSAASPEVLLVKAESPLETEYQELKKNLDATTKFLRSYLDFHIGPQTE
jgi:hypothetical protein